MNSKDPHSLIQQLFDGTISREDCDLLEELLESQEEVAELYREYSLLQFSLISHGRIRRLIIPSIESSNRIRKRLNLARRRQLMGSVAAAVVLFAVAGALLWVSLIDPDFSLAITAAPGSDYSLELSNESDQEVDGLPEGSRVILQQGSLELKFGEGVRSIVTAPAEFVLEEELVLRMHHGSAWFHVQKEAEGFTVVTPQARIVDLGTKFGVISSSDHDDEVHVFEGQVEVYASTGARESAVLEEGDSRRVNAVGRLFPVKAPATPMATKLPKNLHFLHFSFDKVEGTRTPVSGEHPAIKQLKASLVQSDNRSPESRVVEGPFGDALSFDGYGDHVATNWPGVYGGGPLTIACWARISGGDGPNYGGLAAWGLSKHLDVGSHQWKFLIAPGENYGPENPLSRFIRCSTSLFSDAETQFRLKSEEWQHYAMVFEGKSPEEEAGRIRFYLNGEPISETGDSMIIPPMRPKPGQEPDALIIGGGLSGEFREPPVGDGIPVFFQGAIDELYIIEGALDGQQIGKLYLSNSFRRGHER